MNSDQRSGLTAPGSGPLPLAQGSEPSAALQRVLIIGPSNVGDALLIHEVLCRVRACLPRAHIALMVGTRATAVFLDDPRIHTLIDLGLFDGVLGQLRLAWDLWRYQPHILVDLRHTLYPLLLKPLQAWRYLRQPPRAIRHMRDRHLWKLRIQVPDIRRCRSDGGANDRGLEPRASSLERSSMPWCSHKELAHLEQLFHRWGLQGGRRLVVMCPGARSHIKRWMAEGFARVADRLIAEQQVQVVLSGEPDEQSVIEEIQAFMRRQAPHLLGLVTIRQLAAVMERAALVITNDSASLHAASVAGAPTVAIFGPTDAARYGPTAPQRRVVRRRLFCAPCEQALCRFNHECMRFISPDDVYQAACELLNGSSSLG